MYKLLICFKIRDTWELQTRPDKAVVKLANQFLGTEAHIASVGHDHTACVAILVCFISDLSRFKFSFLPIIDTIAREHPELLNVGDASDDNLGHSLKRARATETTKAGTNKVIGW